MNPVLLPVDRIFDVVGWESRRESLRVPRDDSLSNKLSVPATEMILDKVFRNDNRAVAERLSHVKLDSRTHGPIGENISRIASWL